VEAFEEADILKKVSGILKIPIAEIRINVEPVINKTTIMFSIIFFPFINIICKSRSAKKTY